MKDQPVEEPKAAKYELPKSVAEKYEVVGTQIHAVFPGFGEIDMRQLTLPAAEALVKNEFPYLRLKTKPAKS